MTGMHSFVIPLGLVFALIIGAPQQDSRSTESQAMMKEQSSRRVRTAQASLQIVFNEPFKLLADDIRFTDLRAVHCKFDHIILERRRDAQRFSYASVRSHVWLAPEKVRQVITRVTQPPRERRRGARGVWRRPREFPITAYRRSGGAMTSSDGAKQIEVWPQYTNDRVGSVIDCDRHADHAGRRCVPALPQRVANHNHVVAPGAVITRQEGSAN